MTASGFPLRTVETHRCTGDASCQSTFYFCTVFMGSEVNVSQLRKSLIYQSSCINMHRQYFPLGSRVKLTSHQLRLHHPFTFIKPLFIQATEWKLGRNVKPTTRALHFMFNQMLFIQIISLLNYIEQQRQIPLAAGGLWDKMTHYIFKVTVVDILANICTFQETQEQL